MLDFTIYSYGYSEIIYHTLQAIAMFRNSEFYNTIVTTVAIIAGTLYAVQMVAARAEGEWRGSLRRVIGMVIFIEVLLLPKVTMSIKDHVEKSYREVANIPLAFALPIGIVESFGHILTAGFEQVFSLVDGASAHSYYHYGTVFGARLQKEVLRSKVRDPEFISNMSNFIERCVILPSMIGKQFTKEELVASEDMWGLISSRAGTFTRTPMTRNGVRVDPHPKCKDAVPYFEKKFEDAIAFNLTSWSWKFKGAGKDEKYNPGTRELNKNIKAQIGALYEQGSSVDGLLKHNMMINAVNSYRSGKYPAAKAQLHNEAGGFISGDLAEKTLTGSLAVMKVIIYGSYIFLFPVLILSGGIAKYKSWITAAFSLALWPALFSMLNMIIDFAYQPASIVSYSTWATEMKKFDSIASTAANLTLMIPFLSFWITRMGEGGFMHLAGSIMATANSASAALAGEKASGSRNWDNESIRNQSNDNVSSYKHDSSMQYVSGAARSMSADGTTEVVTPGGKALFFGGAGQSSSTGESTYRQMTGISANYEEGVRHEAQAMSSETATRSQTFEKLVAAEASALHSLAENTKIDNGYNIDTSNEEGREVVKAMNEINRLNESNDYGWRQNAETHIKASADPMLVVGRIAKYISGIGKEIGGSVTAGNDSSQQTGSANELSNESGSHSRSGVSSRTSEHSSLMESKGVDKNTQNSIRENYQEVERLDKSIAEHKSNIDSHNKAMNYARNNQTEFSQDQTQAVADRFQERYGGSARAAYEAISRGDPRALALHKEMNSGAYNNMINEVSRQGNKIVNSNNVDEFIASNGIDSSIGRRRDEFANVNHIKNDRAALEQEIAGVGTEIKNTHDERFNNNEANYEQTQKTNLDKQAARKEDIDQHENDRIGNGITSSLIGGVGRPDNIPAQNVKSLNLETGEFEALPRNKRSQSNLESLKTISTVKTDNRSSDNNTSTVEPEEPLNIKGYKTKSRADGQYVDPKQK